MREGDGNWRWEVARQWLLAVLGSVRGIKHAAIFSHRVFFLICCIPCIQG